MKAAINIYNTDSVVIDGRNHTLFITSIASVAIFCENFSHVKIENLSILFNNTINDIFNCCFFLRGYYLEIVDVDFLNINCLNFDNIQSLEIFNTKIESKNCDMSISFCYQIKCNDFELSNTTIDCRKNSIFECRNLIPEVKRKESNKIKWY
jgi:hypothetical protein